MLKFFDDVPIILWGSVAGAVFLLISMTFTGYFWYQSHEINATVTDIEFMTEDGGLYRGNTVAIIRFDDGTILNLDADRVPTLKIGQSYELELRTPYIGLYDKTLVLKGE